MTAEPANTRNRSRAEPGAAFVSGDAGRRHVDRVVRVSDTFFRESADRVSLACWDMAKRFHRGGRLLAFGAGARETDAYHVAVEFVHPVLVGRRALPALALEGNPGRALALLGRPRDIALAFWEEDADGPVVEGLRRAGELGMLTVGLTGVRGESLAPAGVDHLFAVPDRDSTVVQEVHETLYHVLWELVHVFLDRKGLLEEPTSGSCAVCGDEGEVGTVLELMPDPRIARVRLPSGEREVAVEFLDGVRPGDRIVVQLGFAIGTLDEDRGLGEAS
jgi:D-sedoheptulose 7-phosphate isomerase